MTQGSREVLIELLFLALYLDDHLSVSEDEVLNRALNSLGWDAAQSREIFIFKAFTSAREAATCEAKTVDFLEARLGVIQKDGLQAPALTWLYKVLGADGITQTEKQFLNRIETQLYPS
jgi:hypothetical protein